MKGEVSHEDYFSQFVFDHTIQVVKDNIGEERIKLSNDEHFNDIRLGLWDSLPIPVLPSGLLKELGEIMTLGTKVCIYKAAARQIKGGI
jgi:hypothetical protein